MSSPKKRKLRSGFTTGAAAAAAAKAALITLLDGAKPAAVEIHFLTGEAKIIDLHSCTVHEDRRATCTVIKDAGDDPDITDKAVIGATLTLIENPGTESDAIIISGGTGVGTVTKPGLEVPVGQAAINPGPQKMIRREIREALSRHNLNHAVAVEVFVPKGEELAKNTLNARLGIHGGISVLGTTGIVRPMSHEAYIATIHSSLSVAAAMDARHIIMTTGRRSEKHSQNLLPHLPEEAFIQIGDFFQVSIDAATKMDFETITLAVFFGKAVKMAQGIPHTHAAKSELTLHQLAAWAQEITRNRDLVQNILGANTARHAFDYLVEDYPQVIHHVGREMIRSAEKFTASDVRIQSIIFDYEGNVVFNSERE